MPIAPATKLVSDVISKVTRQFGDESGAQLTSTDIIRWINDGQLEITKKNKVIKSIATTTSVANQNVYNFPGVNIINIEALMYNNLPVDYRSFNDFQELVLTQTDVTQLQGAPIMWYEWDDSIYFFPTPSKAGDTITLYYIPYPPVVVNASDALSIPDTYYEQLVQYCMSQAFEMDDDAQNAALKTNQFTQDLNQAATTEDGYATGTYRQITVLQDDA